MYFRIGALKDFAMFTGKDLCWSLSLINIQAWRPVTLLRRDSVKFAKLRTTIFTEHIRWLPLEISHELSFYCIWEQWMVYFVVRIGSPVFISFYCVCFASFYFFSFSDSFLWIPLPFSFEVSLLSILKKSSGVVTRFLSEVSRCALLQPYLVINLPSLVQFGKNLSYILPARAS